MKIADVMTVNPQSLPADTGLAEAMSSIAQRHIRHVPVVEAGRVVGVVSDRDLLAATGGQPERAGGRTLRDVMHTPPVTVRPDDTLVTAAVEIGVRKIGSLPVVDDEHRLVGILTDTDLMGVFVRASRDGLLSGNHDPQVSLSMSREPRVLAPHTPLGMALGLAQAQGFRHLPVMQAGRLIGILSDRDLCRELGRGTPAAALVRDIMTREVSVVGPRDHMTRAAERMIENKISGLPVVEDGTLVGMLSSTDLLEHCLDTLWEA